MGFPPAEVRQMSIWQFMAAADGWAKFHSPKDENNGGGLTEAEKDELFEFVKGK